MNRVATTLKEHEGLWYLEVTACAPDKSVVYAVNAWVDSDPGLHSLLQDHRWFLNRTTKHICCQKARGPLAEAMAEQGHTGQFSLARAVAALSLRGTGKKIRQVGARPHDARLESITIMLQHEAMSPAETADLFGRMAALIPVEPERQLHIPQYERMPSAAEQRHALAEQRREVTERNRAIADARRAAADERRHTAEQRAQAKHFERLQAKAERELARSLKMGGKAMRDACVEEATRQRNRAAAAGEAWAIQAMRAFAGHPLQAGESEAPSPLWYRRLVNGKPALLTLEQAEERFPVRLKRAQAAFEEFCTAITAPLSRAALRAAWLKQFPAHDWVAWQDPDEDVVYTDPVRQDAPKHLVITAPLADPTDEEREIIKRFMETGE